MCGCHQQINTSSSTWMAFVLTWMHADRFISFSTTEELAFLYPNPHLRENDCEQSAARSMLHISYKRCWFPFAFVLGISSIWIWNRHRQKRISVSISESIFCPGPGAGRQRWPRWFGANATPTHTHNMHTHTVTALRRRRRRCCGNCGFWGTPGQPLALARARVCVCLCCWGVYCSMLFVRRRWQIDPNKNSTHIIVADGRKQAGRQAAQHSCGFACVRRRHRPHMCTRTLYTAYTWYVPHFSGQTPHTHSCSLGHHARVTQYMM